MSKLDYDVVIVGAGISGLTLACHLINQNLKIAILDRENHRKVSESDLRVSAINAGSQQILQKCQVWQKLDKTNLSFFQSMEVWEQGAATRLFFDAAETGQACLGAIVKNHDLETALILQAKTASQLDWLIPESLTAIEREDSHITLSLASGRSVTTQLLVGADGAHSCVRQLAGIQTREVDYQQQAIVATVKTELAHEQTARQIFLPTGPLAFLPLANSTNHSSIVWSTTWEEAERLKTLSGNDFCLEVADAFEHRLGRLEETSQCLSFALKTQQCEQYVQQGIALIGDAAHIVHPLAGQGAYLGIADAICLANVILWTQQKQRSFGALYSLRPYERERRFHHRLMGGGINFIKHSFVTQNPFLMNTRYFGLSIIEKLPCLKNYLMSYAMGNPGI